MEIRHLKYFIAIAERRSFRKAAQQLFVGQPALSRAIKDLERDLGVRLFNRRPDGVELTDAGSAMFEHAVEIIASADAARAAMRLRAERDEREVRAPAAVAG